MSRGTKYDSVAKTVHLTEIPERNATEHVTCTIVLYNAVEGGIPSVADVLAAVADLESLYQACNGGNLNSAKFDFMKKELTVKDVQDIHAKVATQPRPPVPDVQMADTFPVTQTGHSGKAEVNFSVKFTDTDGDEVEYRLVDHSIHVLLNGKKQQSPDQNLDGRVPWIAYERSPFSHLPSPTLEGSGQLQDPYGVSTIPQQARGEVSKALYFLCQLASDARWCGAVPKF